MSFGKNPHVAKAETAEQKALDAQDDAARAQAWLEAGRQWERAAEREKDPRRRAAYNDKATAARAAVDAETPGTTDADADADADAAPGAN